MASLRVIGVDLAWSPRNPTGVCTLGWGGRVARLVSPPRADLLSDEEVIDYVADAAADHRAIVAIDCPLAVPNLGGLRPCDVLVNRVFRRYEAGVYPANRGNLGRYGGLRGESIAAGLERIGFNLDPRDPQPRTVIEVYPHAAQVVLFRLNRTLKYKPREGRAYATRWLELTRLQRLVRALRRSDPPLHVEDSIVTARPYGKKGFALKRTEDMLDAIVCAYVGLVYGLAGLRRCAVFGDRKRGHIVVPMTQEFWRRANLRSNGVAFLP